MNQARRGEVRIGWALLGAVLGPALQLQQAHLWPGSVYALVATAGLLLGWMTLRSRVGQALPVLMLAGMVAAGWGAAGWRAAMYSSRALDPALEGRDIVVNGVIAAMPQRSELGTRVLLHVETAHAGEAEVALPKRLLLGWYGGVMPGGNAPLELHRQPAEMRAGERWRFAVRLKAPHGHINPHGFDYELWLWEQGVQATGYVRAGPKDTPPQRLEQSWLHPVEQWRQHVRDAVFARVADVRTAGVLAALVVGDQSAIDRTDWEVFRATGVAHLMSISGLHVTMFAWVAAAILGRAWRRSARLCLAWPAQHAALVGGVALAAAYAAFSGWGVPAQRTIWMLATVALLRLSGRAWPWPWVWLLACAVVVTVDPWALMQPGFWLSFVAVGILFAAGPGERSFGDRKAALEPVAGSAWRARARRIASGALGLLREQWVVTVALTPLSLLLFGQVSVVGLLANLAAIPWITLCVTPLALLGVLLPALWDIAAWALAAMTGLLQVLAALPFSTVSVPAAPLWAGAAGVAGGLLLAMRLPLALRALGVPLLLPVVLWQSPRPAAGEFELLAADVGQGNAVIVRTADHTLVYDAGPRYGPESDAGHRVLVPLLRAYGERVNLLVLSHRDSDHTGGAAALLAAQPQAQMLSSIEASHELQALRAARRCEAGQRWQWDAVDFEVIHPSAQDYSLPGKPNTLSCVLRIGNGRASVLLAGDIERAQEMRLVGGPHAIKSDLLLVPHHGSKTSSTEAFLQGVQPAAALVQAGYRNRFGHPAAAVVQRYRDRDVPLQESQRCGAAHWSSLSPRLVQCERERSRRYWHHAAP